MPRSKPNPFKQALLNGLNVWGTDQFIEALTQVDRGIASDYRVSKRIMEKLMLMPPAPMKREMTMADAFPAASTRDAINVNQLSDVLGLCQVCGKLRAEIIMNDDESGTARSVCGDCYGLPGKEEKQETKLPAEGTAEEEGS